MSATETDLDPVALKAQADTHMAAAHDLMRQSDELRARGELAEVIALRRGDLLHAELELEQARTALTAARAAHDPLAADLKAVMASLASASMPADDLAVLPLDQRLAVRRTVNDSREELEDLAPREDAARQAVTAAEQAVRSFEVDAVAHLKRELAEAESYLDRIPLGNLAALDLVCPITAMGIALRAGLPLLAMRGDDMAPDTMRYLQAVLLPLVRDAGSTKLIQEMAFKLVNTWPSGYGRQNDPAFQPPPAMDFAQTKTAIRGSVEQSGDVPAQAAPPSTAVPFRAPGRTAL